MRLKLRLDALEQRIAQPLKRWHRILQVEGQTSDEAVVAYEAEHGPIGPDEGSILRVVIGPEPAPGCA